MSHSLLHLIFSGALLLTLAADLAAQDTVVVGRDYGYDPVNSTSFLQDALSDPAADVIVVDRQAGPWISDGLLLNRDDVRLVFEPGVVIEALADSLEQFQSLLTLRACRNVVVEGNGGTLRMDKNQYPDSSQFRHCIITRGVDNVVIRDLTLTGAAGDGIEVSADFVVDTEDIDGDGDRTDVEPVVPTTDLELVNLTCDANNRQGCSVISAIGLVIDSCRFTNTNGTAPESGIDFEPFRTYQFLQNITVRNSTFSGNNGNGIQYGGVDVNEGSPPASILIEDCEVFGNGQRATSERSAVDIDNFNAEDSTSSPGTFTMRRCVIRDEPFVGINVRQYATGLEVVFEDVVVSNTLNTPQNDGVAPILIQPRSYEARDIDDPCFGNVRFANVRVIDDEDRDQVNLSQYNTAGAQDVTGDICVESPFEARARIGPNPCSNVTVELTACSGPLPVELVDFSATANVDCTHDLAWVLASSSLLEAFELQRQPDPASPWTVARRTEQGDVSGLTHFRENLPGTDEAYYRLVSRFTDGTADTSAVVFARACANSTEASYLFPNPSSGVVYLRGDSPAARKIRVYDVYGRQVLAFALATGEQRLELAGLTAGQYTIVEEGRGALGRVVLR